MFISKEIPTSQGSNMKESRTCAPFIVSTPRSGSTMFRLMLDAHPELAIPPEANFMSRVILKCEMSINKWVWARPIPKVAKRWASAIHQARSQAKDLRYYMEIRYEDLVLHTESTLKEVCHFIDLRWDPVMLAYYKTAKERIDEFQDSMKHDGRFLKAEERRGQLHLTSKPPQRERIACWKNEMSSGDRELFEN